MLKPSLPLGCLCTFQLATLSTQAPRHFAKVAAVSWSAAGGKHRLALPAVHVTFCLLLHPSFCPPFLPPFSSNLPKPQFLFFAYFARSFSVSGLLTLETSTAVEGRN